MKTLFKLSTKAICLTFTAIIGCSLIISCKTSQTVSINKISKEAQAWYDSKSWKNGFKADGYDDMDVEQFYTQYMKSKHMYDSIFTWLSTIDAINMPAGKKVMTWSHAFANVQDLELRTPDKCKIEQHRNTIDLQWDVTGSEQYGLVRDTSLLEPINKYKVDVQNFRCKTDFKLMNSDPQHFYIFFPTDYHQACGIAKKPETVRKVVVKIEYMK